MINALEYIKGNIQVKIDGHRHVLESAKTLPNGEEIKQSVLTNELPIVKAIAKAVFATTKVSEGVVKFNEHTGLVKWNGSVITPESALTGLPTDIRAFVKAVRTPETIATYNALKPVEYEMENFPHEGIQIINGVPTLVKGTKQRPKTKKVRVKNEDGTPAFKDGEPLFTHVPTVK